jgi:HK97 family phage major capsid protein
MATQKQLAENIKVLENEYKGLAQPLFDADGQLKGDVTPELQKSLTEKANELKSAKEKFVANSEIERDFKSHSLEFITGGEAEEFMSEFKKGQGMSRKSLGEIAMENYDAKAARGGHFNIELKDYSFKTDMTTSAGFAPQAIRTGKVVDKAMDTALSVLDLIPMGTTDQNAVVYMKETTFTNNAAEAAEAAALGESALAYTEASETVQSIGHFIPVSQVQLDDIPQIQSLINNRLLLGLRQKLAAQVINGDGTSPALSGIYDRSVLTQAFSTDILETIIKAIYKVQITGYALPDAALVNPTDLQTLRLLKETTGQYLMGAPYASGIMVVDGVPLVRSFNTAAGFACVGDFGNYCELFERKGATLETGYISDQFKKNMLSMKLWGRYAMTVYRDAAFCKATTTGS